MSTAAGLLALIGAVVLVVGAADVFVDGLLGVGRTLSVAPSVLTVALSGFETENLAAGIVSPPVRRQRAGEPAGRTTQTDTSSQLNPGKSQGRPNE